jgi:hypothetical protein
MFEIYIFKKLGYGQSDLSFLVHCFKKFSFLLKTKHRMNVNLSPIYNLKYTQNYLTKLKQILQFSYKNMKNNIFY